MQKKQRVQQFISYIFLFSFSAFFICVDIQANPSNIDTPKKESSESEKFDPAQVIHENIGCPENSYCDLKTGLRMNGWNNFLKTTKSNQDTENYMKKEGIPIEAWASMEKYENQEMVVWDSHCPAHNTKGSKIKEVMIFTRGILVEENNIIFEDIYLMNSPETITHYLVPRNERPIYMDGSDLVFIKEENDRYIGIKINPKGNIEIVTVSTPAELPVKVDCPPQLKDKYKPQKNNRTLYEGYQCQNLWNIQSKKFETIMYHLTCI